VHDHHPNHIQPVEPEDIADVLDEQQQWREVIQVSLQEENLPSVDLPMEEVVVALKPLLNQAVKSWDQMGKMMEVAAASVPDDVDVVEEVEDTAAVAVNVVVVVEAAELHLEVEEVEDNCRAVVLEVEEVEDPTLSNHIS
jgi:hypothetical protein